MLNSCTVKTPAEDHFRNEIEEAQGKGKSIVVAGCGMTSLDNECLVPLMNFHFYHHTVPQGQPKAGFLQGLSVIGVQQIDRVVEVVEETLKGTVCYFFSELKLQIKHILLYVVSFRFVHSYLLIS